MAARDDDRRHPDFEGFGCLILLLAAGGVVVVAAGLYWWLAR
jgi:hypothetical protein